MKLSYLLLALSVINLSACQVFDLAEGDVESIGELYNQPKNSFDLKLSRLVDEFTASKAYDHKHNATLITTFVWSDSLTYKDIDHPLRFLGHQLSAGVKTELVQREYMVVEHKAAASVAIAKNASYFLSRDIKELAKKSEAVYVIAGTYTEMEGGAMVNVEVVDVRTNIIVGAARNFFPNALFWPANKVTTRNGKIHRGN
jgi:TolB-like protein